MISTAFCATTPDFDAAYAIWWRYLRARHPGSVVTESPPGTIPPSNELWCLTRRDGTPFAIAHVHYTVDGIEFGARGIVDPPLLASTDSVIRAAIRAQQMAVLVPVAWTRRPPGLPDMVFGYRSALDVEEAAWDAGTLHPRPGRVLAPSLFSTPLPDGRVRVGAMATELIAQFAAVPAAEP